MILLVQSNFSDLPTVGTIANDHPQADLALQAEGLIIGVNDTMYPGEVVDFVLNYVPTVSSFGPVDTIVRFGHV